MNIPWASPLIVEPLPLKPTICGPLPALSVIFRVAEMDPPLVGVKNTCTRQLDAAPRLLPQLLPLILKAAAPVPPTAICEMARAPAPLLVMVKGIEPEVPTRWAPKSRLLAETVTAGLEMIREVVPAPPPHAVKKISKATAKVSRTPAQLSIICADLRFSACRNDQGDPLTAVTSLVSFRCRRENGKLPRFLAPTAPY